MIRLSLYWLFYCDWLKQKETLLKLSVFYIIHTKRSYCDESEVCFTVDWNYFVLAQTTQKQTYLTLLKFLQLKIAKDNFQLESLSFYITESLQKYCMPTVLHMARYEMYFVAIYSQTSVLFISRPLHFYSQFYCASILPGMSDFL